MKLGVKPGLMTLALLIYAVFSLVSMATMSIGAALLVLAMVVSAGSFRSFFACFISESKLSASAVYLRVADALAFSCILSLLVAQVSPFHIGEKFSQIHLFSDGAKIWYLFWPILLAAFLRMLPDENRFRILRFWLLSAAALSVVGIVQYFTGWPRPQEIPGTDPLRYHATLFLGHHLSVASVFIFPAFFSTAAFLHSEKRLRLSRFVLGLMSALLLLCLFLTFSRTLWAAAPIGLLVLVFLTMTKKRAAILAVALAMFLIGLTQLPVIQNRIHIQMGVTERKDLWEANWAFFKARPVTGVGWHHNQELSGFYLMDKYKTTEVFSGHAHNVILDQLSGTGLLGLLAWLAWCGVVFFLLFRSRASEPLCDGLIAGWVVFHLNGLTQVNFWEGKVLHQIAWVTGLTLLWASADRVGATNDQG